MEVIKEVIREILFVFGPFEADEGTLKFRFLVWLYGAESAEPMFDTVWPDEEE